MKPCATIDIELYFYDELPPVERVRVGAHLRECAACRQQLDDLHAIRRALAAEPVVDAPPAGDWSGFMRRLDYSTEERRPSGSPPRALARIAAMAAMLAVVATGVFIAGRLRTGRADMPVAGNQPLLSPPLTSSAKDAEADAPILRALRESSAEHLERSKLVVLGLATLDPQHARADDWRYERQLAGSLLPETRLYRMAAQERGVNDVARVMRDLETVLLEASMSDGSDRQSLEHVQRLIARRGLVSNMRIVATAATAGL